MFLIYLFSLAFSSVSHNPLTEPAFPVIQNQGFTSELNKTYRRLPERAKGVVRDAVWELSCESSGLYISFMTNSHNIQVTYSVSGSFNSPNFANTGSSGVDLIAKDPETGKWGSVFTSFKFDATKKTVAYQNDNNREGEFEYRLYFPLHNKVNSDLVIITQDGSSFKWIEKIDYTKVKPIVCYGTSIMHGFSASRPIKSWPTILHRSLDVPLLNFGFSGNGKLETEVIDFIIENDARLYVLDCLPNLFTLEADIIKQLIKEAVKQIRAKRPETPILVVDHCGYSHSDMVKTFHDYVVKSNIAQKDGFDELVAEGVANLHYLTKDEIGLDMDSQTDHIHPNNYGMEIYANSYEKKIKEILG